MHDDKYEEILQSLRDGLPEDLSVPESDTITSVEWKELTNPVKENVRGLAEGLFHSNHRSVIVMGEVLTGKSFIIEQLIAHADYFAERIRDKFPMMFIIDAQTSSMMDPRKLDQYVEQISRMYQVPVKDICFITESPGIAYYLESFECRVILEVSELEDPRPFKSWPVIDVTEIQYTTNELITTLSQFTLEEINNDYQINLTKNDVKEFVKYIQDSSEDSKNASVGRWSEALGFAASSLAFGDYPSSDDRMSQVLDEEFESFIDLLGISTEVSNKSVPEWLTNILGQFGSGQQVVLSGLDPEMLEDMAPQKRHDHVQDDAPLKFRSLKEITRRLKKNVIGQDEAIGKVVEDIAVPAAGLHRTDRPLRSFLFLGPTGVGKTETALTMAREMFTDEMNVIRLDMSEYKDSHNASKLFGSPPGYVGFNEGGKLTTAVQDNPKSLILLDEVEKAHESIWDAFLQVFDAGRMTTGTGEEVDFTNCIIIMTSNLGASELAKGQTGFNVSSEYDSDQVKAIVNNALSNYFSPEFLNRIDSNVIFRSLPKSSITKILKKEINIVTDKAKERGFDLKAPKNDILKVLLQKSNTSKYGARQLQRVVSKEISQPVAHAMLESNSKSGKVLSLKLNNNQDIHVEKALKKESEATQ